MTDTAWDVTPEPPYDATDTTPSLVDSTSSHVTFDQATGTTYVETDLNGDGYVDVVEADLDGDGILETAAHDLDGDGYIDAEVVVDPTSGASTVVMDTDADGVADALFIDHDGDGVVDEAYSAPGGTHDPDGSRTDDASDPANPVDPSNPPDENGLDGSMTTNPDYFVTEDELPVAGDDGIHGDPREDIEYHTVQPGPVDCLPTSVSMIVSEVTGVEVSAEAVVDLANESGFMTDTGMSLDNSLALLQAYGVDATLETGSADALRDALDNGDEVIIGLDSADLYADGGGPFDPGMAAGHAVVLTGIDDGPPAYVYINDPAFTDGAGVQVPLDEFLDAWQDAEYQMVTVEAPDATGDDAEAGSDAASINRTAADGVADSDSDDASRLILIPVTLLTNAVNDLFGNDRTG